MEKTTETPTQSIRRTLFSFREDVDFANDVALLFHTRHDLEEKKNTLNNSSQQLEQNINEKKSKVNPILIYIDQQEQETTYNFTYLGSIIFKDGGANVDIKNHIQ